MSGGLRSAIGNISASSDARPRESLRHSAWRLAPACWKAHYYASVSEYRPRTKVDKHDKIPSPCIDVCEDIGKRCIACGRSKKDKKRWKKAEGREEKMELLRKCLETTQEIGTQQLWIREYRRRCAKKGADCPLDELMAQAEA
jgi:predicted Fe-S protein YdhL (DUF1289 family)